MERVTKRPRCIGLRWAKRRLLPADFGGKSAGAELATRPRAKAAPFASGIRSDVREGAAGYAPRAKAAPFASGIRSDVREGAAGYAPRAKTATFASGIRRNVLRLAKDAPFTSGATSSSQR